LDLFDRLALFGRRYTPRRSAISGSTQLSLEEVLRIFHGKTILDIETRPTGEGARRALHETGRPVSLLDAIAAVDGGKAEWYEVLQTAPTGDYARARVVSKPSGGELSMLVGRRMPEHTSVEDPVLKSLPLANAEH
jgi:hypothetical protein